MTTTNNTTATSVRMLPEETARQLHCNVEDYDGARHMLIKALKDRYPEFDYLMLVTSVEHYLDHPNDTPEDILARAPKNYFHEDNAKVHPPSREFQGLKITEFNGILPVHGPPGGRGTIVGQTPIPEEEEEEKDDVHATGVSGRAEHPSEESSSHAATEPAADQQPAGGNEPPV